MKYLLSIIALVLSFNTFAKGSSYPESNSNQITITANEYRELHFTNDRNAVSTTGIVMFCNYQYETTRSSSCINNKNVNQWQDVRYLEIEGYKYSHHVFIHNSHYNTRTLIVYLKK